MKVVKNKISKSIRGEGGGKSDIDNLNVSLMAPLDGTFLQSREFVKSLDLVCEGPIQGFVDADGNRAEGKDVLKGIYLNDTPVMTSEGKFNFNNISVDYRYGKENQGAMTRHQAAVVQKEINFALLGPFIGNNPDRDTDIRVTSGGGSTTDFANWNSAKSVNTNRNAYTHIIRNDNVKSVQLVFNISKLNDTRERSDTEFQIISERNLFGGSTDVDLQFRIGQPIDKDLRIEVEFGLLNVPNFVSSQTFTFRGQTALGYLVEISDFGFANTNKTYRDLQGSKGFEDFTINQLKSNHPRYIRAFKVDFETDSTLINSEVSLAYVKENFKTDFRYPSSALVGTVVDSSNFDQIPDRSYDTQLLKAFVPINYEPLNANSKDKRFNEEIKPFSFTFEEVIRLTKDIDRNSLLAHHLVNENRLPEDRLIDVLFQTPGQEFGGNDGLSQFGAIVSVAGDDTLAVSDPRWGLAGAGYNAFGAGQIYFYDMRGTLSLAGPTFQDQFGDTNAFNTVIESRLQLNYRKFTKLRSGTTSQASLRELAEKSIRHNFHMFASPETTRQLWIKPSFDTTTIQSATQFRNEDGDHQFHTELLKIQNKGFPHAIDFARRLNAYDVSTGSNLVANWSIVGRASVIQKPLPYNLGNEEYLYVEPFSNSEFSGDIRTFTEFGEVNERGEQTSAARKAMAKFVEDTGFLPLWETAVQCHGYVIGGVFDFHSPTPDVVFLIEPGAPQVPGKPPRIVNVTIRNRFSRRLYIKIFAAQVLPSTTAGENPASFKTKYGYEPKNETGGGFLILPSKITMNFVTLVDIDYKFITDMGENILDASRNYLITDALEDRSGGFDIVDFGQVVPLALIAKKDDLGVWRKYHLELSPEFRDDFDELLPVVGASGLRDTRMLESAAISDDEKIAVMMFRDRVGGVRKNLIKVMNLADKSISSFHETTGIFEDRIIGKVEIESRSTSSFPGISYYGDLQCPDNRTIIITKETSKITFIDKRPSDDTGPTYGTITMVYRLKNRAWSLDQIVLGPNFRGTDGNSRLVTGIGAIGKYLVVGHDRGDGQAPYGGGNLGYVDLFKYNGKNYEYVTVFTPESIRQLVSDGTTFSSPFPNNSNPNRIDEVFGSSVQISLNDNGDPMIGVIASRSTTDPQIPHDPFAGRTGRVYVIVKHPQKEEFVLDNIHVPQQDSRASNFFELMTTTLNGKHRDTLALSKDFMAFGRGNTDGGGGNFINDTLEIVRIRQNKNNSTRIYENDLFWNGILQRKWTDNPAWIIYDLLTNNTHGAGSMVDAAKDVNVFNFYDVGRYFDSVDDDGYFLPLYDEKGQTEPRLSCNFLVKKDYNAFDLINAVSDLFFGALYIEDGKYNLWADRPTEPSWAFSNSDVVNGDFTYSEKYKQDKVTVVKVPFLDKYESFKKKIEYVEDGNLLREYGKIEKELNFTAFTSRSQARRYGKQFLYNNSYETEIVNFQTDDNALFLSPGNVIEISDQLRNFSTKKEIYSIESFNFEERLHIVNRGLLSGQEIRQQREIRYSEGLIKNGDDVSNAVYTHTDYILADNIIYENLAIKVNSEKLPYIFVGTNNNDSNGFRFAVLKKNGDTFDQVSFSNADFGYVIQGLESNVVIDGSDNVIIPFITERQVEFEGQTFPQAEVGYFKYSGGDFTDTSNWTSTIITDDQNFRFSVNTGFGSQKKIIGQIDSSGFLYLLARAIKDDGGEDKYLLYKINTSDNSFEKFSGTSLRSVDPEFRLTGTKYDFDMKLKNNLPAIVYKSIGRNQGEPEIRYTEQIGSFSSDSGYNNVFVWGSVGDRLDTIQVFFNDDNDVYISHNSKAELGDEKRIYYARAENRFDNKEWASNRILWDSSAIGFKSPIVFLRNQSLVTFLGGFLESFYQTFTSRVESSVKKGLQTFQLKDTSGTLKPQKFTKNIVYRVENDDLPSLGDDVATPSVDYSFSQPFITLNNYDKHLYDNQFSIDTNKTNNLMITALEKETLEEAYNGLATDNFRFESEKSVTNQKHFLNITGFEFNGDLINLFPKQEKNTADIFDTIIAKNSIVQVMDDTVKNKQYRVQNISEIDKNLYEITAKEFHSGKFNFIETYEKPEEAEETLFNIGVPKNNIFTPPAPSAVDFVTGTDAIGVKFITGSITGVAGGIETKYRATVTYPNGKDVTKEFEKDSDNLTPSNEPITNFAFYNLPTVGEYNVKFKSLKNPESSSFIEKTFSIENDDPIVFTNPLIREIDIKSDGEKIKINVDVRDIFDKRMILSSHNYYLTIKIQDEEILVNQRVDQFEFSLDELKEFTKKLVREMRFEVELRHNNEVIDSLRKTLLDMPPEILNAKIMGATDLLINAEIKEFEKVRSIMIYANDKIIKTFFPNTKELFYNIPLYDFDIHELPEDEVIKFKIIAQDAFGDSEAFNFDGVIPGSTSAIQRYQDSIAPIYSAQYWDHFSGELSNFESSNNQTGFYGNGSKAICEVSSSMISGESGNIKLELNSNNDSNEINLNFKNKGYLSQKTIMDMSKDFYGVNISTESGVFEGFEFKVKKI